VAVPSEHGGWGLTLEPVLLGLAVAPSLAGGALGVAAFLVFLLRTPVKLVLVDVWRHRWLDRSSVALRFALAESVALAVLVGFAVRTSGWSWLAPVAVAAPLVGVELWFDVRSRGRRLVPELCGAIGIAASAAVIVLAAGRSGTLAAGVWLVHAARSVGAIPFVRVQLARWRRGVASTVSSDALQAGSVAVGALAVAIERRMLVGLIGLAALAGGQTLWVRRPPVAAKVLGLRQMMMGLALVAVTAAGVHALGAAR
jgi:YwiC-like protein